MMFPYFLPFYFVIALLYVPSLAQAQAVTFPADLPYKQPISRSSHSLTLQQAIQQALQSNPELAAATLEMNAVDAEKLQAGVRPNPEIATVVEDTRKATRSTTLQLNQTVELGGKRGARIKVAEKDQEIARADLTAKRIDTKAEVVNAYFSVLEAQENLQLLQNTLRLAQHATEITVKRVNAGKLAPIEATKANVVETGVEVELQQAAGTLQIARRSLAMTWGEAIPLFSEVDGQINHLPVLPEMSILQEHLQNSPFFQKPRLELERREALVQLERSQRIPDLTVSIGGKRSEENRLNQFVFGLSLPIPVFDQNQHKLQAALQRADKARDELRGTQLRLNSALFDAYTRLTFGQEQVTALRSKVLPAAQNSYEITAKGFELGKFSYLEVLDAQRVLFQAKSQVLRALVESHRAAIEIERIVGILPVTDSL